MGTSWSLFWCRCTRAETSRGSERSSLERRREDGVRAGLVVLLGGGVPDREPGGVNPHADVDPIPNLDRRPATCSELPCPTSPYRLTVVGPICPIAPTPP